MRLASRCYLIAFAALAVFASACDEKLRDIAGPTPNLQPTFSSIQREIFNTTDSAGRAACIQCHTNIGRTPPLGLPLNEGVSYAALVGQASRGKAGAILVVPGDPEASYLIHKLEGRSDIVGQRMPRTSGPFLTSGQISIIERWIALGARND